MPTKQPTDDAAVDEGIVLNSRTLILAFAFLLGGGSVGAGASALGEKVPQDVRDSIADTKRAAESTSEHVAELSRVLVRLEAEMGSDRAEAQRTAKAISDHEDRIRVLERRAR